MYSFSYMHAYIRGVKQNTSHYIPHVFAESPYLQGNIYLGSNRILKRFIFKYNAQHYTT